MSFKSSAINDSEELDFDKIFLAMDFFREAIFFSRDKCLEIEAEALSRLGEINDFVRADLPKAKEYYTSCLTLAHSMQPMNFGTKEWYKLASSRLQKFQEEAAKKEELNWDKQRGPVVDEIKAVLDELKAENGKGFRSSSSCLINN